MVVTLGDFASLFGIIAVFVAILALVIESRRERLILQTDLLLRLDEKLHSSEYLSLRRIAAQKILVGETQNYELEGVLELLSTIAFLYDRKAIDTDLTYKQFAYWLDRFWLCGKSFVYEESRKYDPLSYKTLERIAEKFIMKELESGYPPFSQEVLASFLCDEINQDISRNNSFDLFDPSIYS